MSKIKGLKDWLAGCFVFQVICSFNHATIAYEGLFCPVCELRDLIAELEEKVETLWAMAEEKIEKRAANE